MVQRIWAFAKFQNSIYIAAYYIRFLPIAAYIIICIIEENIFRDLLVYHLFFVLIKPLPSPAPEPPPSRDDDDAETTEMLSRYTSGRILRYY